jgi:hypothetical protein
MRPLGLRRQRSRLRKPLSVTPFTTQMTGGGLARHGTR